MVSTKKHLNGGLQVKIIKKHVTDNPFLMCGWCGNGARLKATVSKKSGFYGDAVFQIVGDEELVQLYVEKKKGRE